MGASRFGRAIEVCEACQRFLSRWGTKLKNCFTERHKEAVSLFQLGFSRVLPSSLRIHFNDGFVFAISARKAAGIELRIQMQPHDGPSRARSQRSIKDPLIAIDLDSIRLSNFSRHDLQFFGDGELSPSVRLTLGCSTQTHDQGAVQILSIGTALHGKC